MEKSKYRLPVIKKEGKENAGGKKNMYESMVSLEQTHSCILYRKYNQNEYRKKRNDMEMIKKQILRNFRFELEMGI